MILMIYTTVTCRRFASEMSKIVVLNSDIRSNGGNLSDYEMLVTSLLTLMV